MDRLLVRFALALGIVMIVALLLLSAAIFFCAALFLALMPVTGAAGAAALTGLAALLVTGLVLLAGRLILAPRRPALRAQPLAGSAHGADDAQIAQALSALFGEELGRTFHNHPKGAAAASLAAGFAFGLSPQLRRLILGLFESGR
jgi:hypothetical protein